MNIEVGSEASIPQTIHVQNGFAASASNGPHDQEWFVSGRHSFGQQSIEGQQEMVARCRSRAEPSRDDALTALEKVWRISCWRSVMVTLEALPGMVENSW